MGECWQEIFNKPIAEEIYQVANNDGKDTAYVELLSILK